MKRTLYSQAHLEVGSASYINGSAGVSSSIEWLDEGNLQGSRAEHSLANGFTEWLPIFMPRDGGRRGTISLALQCNRGVHWCLVLLSL